MQKETSSDAIVFWAVRFPDTITPVEQVNTNETEKKLVSNYYSSKIWAKYELATIVIQFYK